MAATFSGKQNQGGDIRSLMHCLRWLVPHLKGERGPESCNNLFYSTCMTNKLIIYSSKCFCHFTPCWMLFAARFNSICFINFRRASKKRCEKKGFNGMHPSLEKSFSWKILLFSTKKCCFEEKRTAQVYFSWSQALTGGSQVETFREGSSSFIIFKKSYLWFAVWSRNLRFGPKFL